MAAAKITVSDIAKRMNRDAKDIIFQLQSLGADVSDANQAVEPEAIQALITGKKVIPRTRSSMSEDKPRKSVSMQASERSPVNGQTFDVIMEGVFTDRALIREILDTLEMRRNVILQGAPGVGKTYFAKRLARALIGEPGSGGITLVQFHQSYSYEDFVQGFRPKKKSGGFELRNGPFVNLVTRALAAPSARFVLIIDEINRGNVSRIFGELLMLVEYDKREKEYAVALAYSPDVLFFVPPNVFLIGLMNTADRSLAMVDYALRRRFCFFTVPPAFDSPTFRTHLESRGGSRTFVDALLRRCRALNDVIRKDRSLGPGFEIGHSYFCPANGEQCNREWLERVIRRDIRPLLREYWFDTPERADEEASRLLG